MSRRDLLQGVASAVGLTAGGCAPVAEAGGTVLPPTAGSPEAFWARCIRCYRCGEVCTAGCIAFHPPWARPDRAGTPYIEPRRAGCNTCMRCTSVCPSGALTPVPAEKEAVLAQIDMGTAYVDHGLCLSYQGRVCGVCHDACPYPGDAIRLVSRALPEVLDACVGCGRCEERCPQVPAAIRVFRDDPGPRWVGPGEHDG
ncbi:MAG: 4Fe-4S dicluster domain-containing protein [Alphaproteobacteria bacterium]|nr:4Fe-4S dicluster domain-containing protein [Alphaproteobacteria bacterium]